MAGLLLDIVLIASVAAFAWGGLVLGSVATTTRLLAAIVGAVCTVLLRDAGADVVDRLTPLGSDGATLAAISVLAVLGFGLATQLLGYFAAWLPPRVEQGRLRWAGAAAGAFAGAGWGAVMLCILLLLPSDNAFTTAAAESRAGAALVGRGESMLRWVGDGLPRLTQTLPKGQRGAVVGPRRDLPLHGLDARPALDEAGELLANVNQLRFDSDLPELQFNRRVADAATRHARAMVEQRTLDTRVPGVRSLRDRVGSGLAGDADRLSEQAELVVWASATANAVAALRESESARALLLDERFTEVGIGVVDAGFYDGMLFALAFVGPDRAARDTGRETASRDSAATDPA